MAKVKVIHADGGFEYWMEDYWLGHCEGFRVEAGSRRLGFVEEVVGDEEEPESLLVRGGLFANRVYRIPVSAIDEIEPRAERILLRPARELAK